MERSTKAPPAASRRLTYGSSTAALFTCTALITLAYFSLITVSSPTLLSASNMRTLFGLLHSPHQEDLDLVEGNRLEYERRIKQVFEKASMTNRTIILTTLNEAWANEDTMINLFLESFWLGNGTQRLLRHLIFICVDEKAYERCLVIHPHCIRIETRNLNLSEEQVYLSTNYINLMWRRIKFLKTTLEMNFDFILTDTDVLWFRNPIPLLQNDTKVDMQIASDHYNGRPWDIKNEPNAGFMYVRANERTINFFNYWYQERKMNSSLATQGIFNIIKFNETFKNIGMNLRFLDPQLFSGFCGIKHTDMRKSITMHATCCKGLEAKVNDLRMILDGWKRWQQLQNLKKPYPELLNSNNSLHNQSIIRPCDGTLVHDISPKFGVPWACIKSLRNANKH